MDEECLLPGEASDLTFLTKLNSKLNAHPHYLSFIKGDNKTKKTIDREEFRLLHYAGEVTYNVHGFLEKNNDLLYRDLKEAMIASSNHITKAVSFCTFTSASIKYMWLIVLFLNKVFTANELNSKKRPETAASQFKNSLALLVEILMKKEPSYIRCIKPNESKKPNTFEVDIVTHQVG